MGSQRTIGKFACHVQKIRQRVDNETLAFQSCLSADLVSDVVQQLGIEFRERIFTPCLTLWAFLSQIMSAVGSCRFAVLQVLAYLTRQNKPPCSPTTSSYCEARSRLPEAFYARLVDHTGRRALEQTPRAWQFKGRPVKVIDGSTVLMPDTEANQQEYPLADPTRKGLSFPMARLLVVFSLAVGTVIEHVIGPYRGKGTGELSLFRRQLDTFTAGDILLGDRGFCSYGHGAWLVQRGVDVVIKLNASRLPNVHWLRRLGKGDALYRWHKPKGKPESFSREEFAALPEAIDIRIVEVCVTQAGFRPDRFQVVTTLRDPAECSAAEISELFRQRWRCELYLRDLKSTLGMGMLRCETPGMVRREILTYLLAYNVIRLHMAQAAEAVGLSPQQLSFQGAVAALQTFHGSCAEMRVDHRAILLATLAYYEVGKQLGRCEPRKIKRRPKHEYLTEPRHVARKRLLEKPLAS
jgi:Transposase DDE domain